jgi:tRNA pseudouridine38-40 synthase
LSLRGSGFLYNMVRIIAGTLVEVGLGKLEPEEIKQIILDKKRENAGKTLPPNGLYLINVEYDS